MTLRMKGSLDMDCNHISLRIVYDTRDQEILKKLENNGILVEFDPKDFRKMLLEEFDAVQSIGRAFDRVCDKLRILSGTV